MFRCLSLCRGVLQDLSLSHTLINKRKGPKISKWFSSGSPMDMSAKSQSSPFSSETVKDIFLWRRKTLSVLVLLVATAMWVVFDVYEFNFITVASWVAMLIVTLLFVYGNLVRLFRKEKPNLSGFEMSKQTAMEIANSIRESSEEEIRWMFSVSAEREWFVFVRAIVVLWILSYVGNFFDFLTLLYLGIVVGMTLPVVYETNEEKIKRFLEWIKMGSRRLYQTIDEKVFQKLKNKVVTDKGKEKKVE